MKYIPWISLVWGVFSVFLIGHDLNGIHKFVFFAALFAAVALLGVFFPQGRSKALDWLKLVSQQSAAQYILFFAVPLLWKTELWVWLTLVTTLALSTLWDPLYNRLWRNAWYRLFLITVSLTLVVSLSVVTWAPRLLNYSTGVALLVCILAQVGSSFAAEKIKQAETGLVGFTPTTWRKIFLKDVWQGFLLFAVYALSGTPLPPLGVWVVEGRIEAHTDTRSVECVTRIAAPAGFRSGLIHSWSIDGSQSFQDNIVLSEVMGNGIDAKPFTTRSRKQAFPLPYEEILKKTLVCRVSLPGNGEIGAIEMIPTGTPLLEQP
ncbi:MAG: hypothetical protein FJY29_00805 [Betaproteobacteria bacterium]|nr:hypothetical protein [Betaproteobacteria bacterium]